MELPLME